MSDAESRVCPACGRAADPEASFCEVCGADLHAEVAEGKPHAEFAEGKPHAESAEGKLHAESAKVAEEKPHAESAKVAEEKPHAESAEVAEGKPDAESAESVRNAIADLFAARRASSDAGEPCGRAAPAAPARPQVAAARPVPPPPPVFDASPMRADPSDAVPFELEWDEARRFIEGVQCAFSFRVRSACRIAKLGFRVVANGSPVGEDIVFAGLRAGDERETTVPFVPRVPGQVVVKLRAETLLDRGAHESFAAARDFEHVAEPFRRFLAEGDQNINIDIRDNDGIIRLDELKLPRQAIVDLKEEIDRVLSCRGRYRTVAFCPGEIRRERMILSSSAGDGIRDLLVLPGTDCVTFGTSSHADAWLLPETEGRMDDKRASFISGIHFSIQNNRSRHEFELRNGGPSARNDDRSRWRASTNGLNVDGSALQSSPLPLRPGETRSVDLAPYAVSGGSLSLSLEPRGWDDPAAAVCDWRTGNLSSLLVRRGDNPHKAILVVWGAAALDPLLGTESGLRVASLDGRLFLVDRHGEAARIHRLAGHALPGTPFSIS